MWKKNHPDNVKKTKKKHCQHQKEYYQRWYKIRRQEKKEWLLNYKSTHPCITCGESNPVCLDFHHPGGCPKNEIRSICEMLNYQKETILKAISKCEILCCNCHRKIHAKSNLKEKEEIT